jgi:hypothetical protein
MVRRHSYFTEVIIKKIIYDNYFKKILYIRQIYIFKNLEYFKLIILKY